LVSKAETTSHLHLTVLFHLLGAFISCHCKFLNQKDQLAISGKSSSPVLCSNGVIRVVDSESLYVDGFQGRWWAFVSRYKFQ
jgi:hypothetical protein